MKFDSSTCSLPETSPQRVGENIRALRRRAHLSQGELARRLGALEATKALHEGWLRYCPPKRGKP